jgi:hypothetical protein
MAFASSLSTTACPAAYHTPRRALRPTELKPRHPHYHERPIFLFLRYSDGPRRDMEADAAHMNLRGCCDHYFEIGKELSVILDGQIPAPLPPSTPLKAAPRRRWVPVAAVFAACSPSIVRIASLCLPTTVRSMYGRMGSARPLLHPQMATCTLI